MHARFLAVAVLALTLAAPLRAEENIVAPAPTPAPAAGPTKSAAEGFCGEAAVSAKDLIQRYSTDAKLKQVYKSNEYLAYADNDKEPTVMYTLTTDAHAAHPAAVCRRIVKEGESAVINMNIVCDGAKDACTKLTNDFSLLTAQMQAAVDAKIKAQGK